MQTVPIHRRQAGSHRRQAGSDGTQWVPHHIIALDMDGGESIYKLTSVLLSVTVNFWHFS